MLLSALRFTGHKVTKERNTERYQEHLWNRGDLIAGRQTVKKPITTNGSIWSEFPELPEKPAWLANIEDCTERRDG
jgi:hypothetical protein